MMLVGRGAWGEEKSNGSQEQGKSKDGSIPNPARDPPPKSHDPQNSSTFINLLFESFLGLQALTSPITATAQPHPLPLPALSPTKGIFFPPSPSCSTFSFLSPSPRWGSWGHSTPILSSGPLQKSIKGALDPPSYKGPGERTHIPMDPGPPPHTRSGPSPHLAQGWVTPRLPHLGGAGDGLPLPPLPFPDTGTNTLFLGREAVGDGEGGWG